MEHKVCELVEGVCKRHCVIHNPIELQLCLDPSDRGEAVRVALDSKYAEQIAAGFNPQSQKKSGCKGCGKGNAMRELDQRIRDRRLSANSPKDQTLPKGGCTDCGRAKRMK